MVRQHYFRLSGQKYTEDLITEDIKYANYYLINKYMHDLKNPDYNALPANTAQEVLKQVDKQYSSFFKLLKKKQSGQYSKKVNIPGYKNKNGYNILVYNRMFISQKHLDKGIVKIPKTNIEIKVNKDKLKDFSQLRIILSGEEIALEFVYDSEVKDLLVNNRYYALDLGVNNLAAVSSNCSRSFLINGKPLKQINQRFNKTRAHLQEKLNIRQQVLSTIEDKSIEITDEVFKEAQKKNKDKIRYTSHKINKIAEKRKHKIEDYLHKTSRYIINQAVENQVGTIFIGHNSGWKQDINIGDVNNQNFVNIPFNKFINMVQYKGLLEGIKVEVLEESYTSKASFLDKDFIPTYDENVETNYKFSGRRIHRGLYKSNKGLINADLNGSFNIMRKGLESLNVKSDVEIPGNTGQVFCPQKITF